MSLKGKGYLKTSWTYQERPVSSNKLNLWDDRIEEALELVHFLLNAAWGGGNGVIQDATAKDLLVEAATPVGFSVLVNNGYAFISGCAYKLANAVYTADVIPPVTHPRRDLVQARLTTWDVSVKTGTESATPALPTPDTDCIPLAELYLRAGMSSIKNTDDGVNGYIVDARNLL